MEQIKGIIDFHREEKLTSEETEKIIKIFREGKKIKGKMNVIADGNFVQFFITEEDESKEVVSFVTDFSSLVVLIQDLGFDIPISNEMPSKEEQTKIEEDAKHDGHKKYLEESKGDIIIKKKMFFSKVIYFKLNDILLEPTKVYRDNFNSCGYVFYKLKLKLKQKGDSK